ncbi:MAG TPA: hypothetical protein VJL29_02520 [Thermoguttaceae bacterium]|nr:hypothetical protein [Thermoguttaceae bacterium]
MTFLADSAVPWAVVSIQILGLASACLARFSEGCSCQRLFQGLFFLFLTLVAGSAVVALRFGPDCWLKSGGVLAVMAVVATIQLGRSREAVAW